VTCSESGLAACWLAERHPNTPLLPISTAITMCISRCVRSSFSSNLSAKVSPFFDRLTDVFFDQGLEMPCRFRDRHERSIAPASSTRSAAPYACSITTAL